MAGCTQKMKSTRTIRGWKALLRLWGILRLTASSCLHSLLKGFAPETIVTAVLFSMVGYFNGHDKTLWVMTQGLIQTLLVRLPLAYYMSIQPDASLTRIGLAAPAATFVGIILNVLFYRKLKQRQAFPELLPEN